MTFEEQVREMNEEGVFKKMYQRELARGKIQSNQYVQFVYPDAAGTGVAVKFIRKDQMTDDYPILGRWDWGDEG